MRRRNEIKLVNYGWLALATILGGSTFALVTLVETRPDAIITDYEADVHFDTTGRMHVTERHTIAYNRAFSAEFRDIDYTKFSDDYPLPYDSDNTASLDSESVDVRVYDNGTDVTADMQDIGFSFDGDLDEFGNPVVCDPERPRCESVFVYAGHEGFDGTMGLTYTFAIDGVITRYDDVAEWNWALYDTLADPVEDGVVKLHLPSNDADVEDFDIWVHGVEADVDIVDNERIVISFIDAPEDHFLEIRLLVPLEVFDDLDDAHVFVGEGMDRETIVAFQQGLTKKVLPMLG